jgi:hypothetical protein
VVKFGWRSSRGLQELEEYRSSRRPLDGRFSTPYSIEPDRWADFLGLGSTKAHDQHVMDSLLR